MRLSKFKEAKEPKDVFMLQGYFNEIPREIEIIKQKIRDVHKVYKKKYALLKLEEYKEKLKRLNKAKEFLDNINKKISYNTAGGFIKAYEKGWNYGQDYVNKSPELLKIFEILDISWSALSSYCEWRLKKGK